MRPQKYIPVLMLVVLLIGFTGIWKLQHTIDAQRAGLYQEQDEILLRSGKLMKIMSLEYAPLVATIYWTRVVQYYGIKRVHHDPDLDSLWPLLDVTTSLDPNLIPAYRFGSTFLAEPRPRGAGRPDLAIELLERGISANRDQWRLYQDLGYVYYFELKDYKKAAAAFEEGSKNPKAAIWMKVMAARIAERGESRETSRFLWTEVYNSTQDAQLKDNARIQLLLLHADDDIDQLNLISAEYEKKTGRKPTSMQQLVEAGLLPGEPFDPKGYVYVLGADGKAALNPESPLYKELPIYRRSF